MIDLRIVTLAILAGGRGSRMGMPKALLSINEQPILKWQLDRLNWPGPTLLVTTPALPNPPAADAFDQLAIDPDHDQGPLRGILTALQHTRTDNLAIIPVDMPRITPPQLQWMVDQLGPDVCGVMCRPAASQFLQPLPIAIHRSAVSAVQRVLDSPRRAIGDLAQQAGFTTRNAPADWPANTWMNLNTPQALRAFVDRINEEK